MSTLRVLVVDDEPLTRERVGALVRETKELEWIGEARNGLEALNFITTHQPDLVFIDVEMPELSGFGVIAALDGAESHIPGVVFVTAYERYAVRAFDVGAIDYLHKPITRQRFRAAVARAQERLTRNPELLGEELLAGAKVAERGRGFRTHFVIRRVNKHYFVRVGQIDWIDAADNYLQLHVGDRVHLARGTMKNAEDELDPERFMRIHRSTIVAVDRIASVSRPASGHVVRLTTGVRLRTSRQYAARVRVLLKADRA